MIDREELLVERFNTIERMKDQSAQLDLYNDEDIDLIHISQHKILDLVEELCKIDYELTTNK